MGTIYYQIREDKPDKSGKCPLRLIYRAQAIRKYINVFDKDKENRPLSIIPACWSSDNQEAIYLDKRTAKQKAKGIDPVLLLSKSEVEEFNGKLAAFTTMITEVEKRFELDKIVYSSEDVIRKLQEIKSPVTKKSDPTNFLFDFIDKYIEAHKPTRVSGSLAVYKNLKNHLRDYQQHTKKKISFDKIDYSFFQSYQTFLLSKTIKAKDGSILPALNNTTIAKQLSTVKTFLSYAKKEGVKVSDNYKDFEIKRQPLEVIALTNEEFETLFYYDLTANKRLSDIRDVFCFSCATGLRYSDLAQLKREHIKADEIKIVVKKTKEPLTIPLNPYSQAILERHKERHQPLPIISNQKLNDYVHELCELAGINEPVEIVRFRGSKREATIYPKYELVSCHTGRKTFATLSLEKGMSAEEVMSIGGWREYSSFKRYVKVTEQRKKVVMRNAWGEIKIPSMKVV